jgi:type I restriction enzyme S subunit
MINRWPATKVGDVLTQVWREEHVDASTEYRILGTRWYGDGLFVKDVKSGQNIRATSLYKVQSGDFVYNRLFAWKGSFAVASAEVSGAYVSNEFPCFVPNPERIDVRFLWWYFRRERAWTEALGLSVGATPTSRNRLKEVQFLKMTVPLPPLEEQHRIVLRLEDIAAKIREARVLRKEASEEADTLRWQSASRALDKACRGRPLRPLSEVVTILGGGTPSKSIPSYWEGTIPWISPKDMKSRELRDAIDHISEQATHETAAKLIAPHSVLVVVRGMILAHTFPSAILRVPAAINQDMKALVPSHELLPEFLCALFWAQNSKMVAGSRYSDS